MAALGVDEVKLGGVVTVPPPQPPVLIAIPELEKLTLAPAHAAPLTVTGVCANDVVVQATKPSIEPMQNFLNRERLMNLSLT